MINLKMIKCPKCETPYFFSGEPPARIECPNAGFLKMEINGEPVEGQPILGCDMIYSPAASHVDEAYALYTILTTEFTGAIFSAKRPSDRPVGRPRKQPLVH